MNKIIIIILVIYWIVLLVIALSISGTLSDAEQPQEVQAISAEPVIVPYLNFDIKDLEKRRAITAAYEKEGTEDEEKTGYVYSYECSTGFVFSTNAARETAEERAGRGYCGECSESGGGYGQDCSESERNE